MRAAALAQATGVSLGSLLQGLAALPARYDRRVTGLALDSRTVRPGDLFFALVGGATDGRRFVDEALARRAAAVAQEAPAASLEARHGVPVIGVPGLDQQVGRVADRFYGHPSADLWVAGVTGTNGKTTVSHLIAQALTGEGGSPGAAQRCGVVGTLGSGVFGELRPSRHTTPDAITLHRLLADLRGRGLRHVAMEVSSHALVQGRVNGVAFDVAAFTNLTRDHLDYHGSLEAYAEAKRRLFRFPGLKTAVVNVDDPVGAAILERLDAGVDALGYSLTNDPRARVRARTLEVGPAGLRLEVVTPAGDGVLESPLLGRFNAGNLLAALGVLLTLRLPLPGLLAALGRARPVAGRMERHGGQEGQPLVVIDYAHTPDALESVLATLREHCRGRLACVFGCGGERDRGKRPEMGAAAERLADEVVVTDDNPRREDPDLIVADVLGGMARPERARVERDRARAIALAVGGAGAGDVVLVAGKGHEDYQEVGGQRRPYSDRAVVRALLDGRPA
ncbi:MAG: UDP-N-acetylmuramoyl-L-alanyl-D-glutamate--2,6-diaminopimelate ligase [Gammaproteobacteria bacterium]|nr:UDP-N-acetylmuramoyl-L-alanyl-D-glutamate--2,6-diaminopimelate ligase [Gammaproteobacteria bacterium]